MGQSHALLVSLGKLADRLMHNFIYTAQVCNAAYAGELLITPNLPDGRDIVQIIINQHIMVKRSRFRQISQYFFTFQDVGINAQPLHMDTP